MGDVAEGLIRVAELVVDDGFPVTFRDGWRDRGRGRLTPRGAVNHWTAGPRTGDHPSLDIVTRGRAGLRNALCNTYSSREPRLYIVAARTAWHAGRGSWRGLAGNSSVLGHEAENSGHGEWSDEHLALIASLDRAQCEVFGYSVDMVCDHFEWTPRKVDRMDVGGEPWRQRLRNHQPAPEPDEEDDDMKMEIWTGTDPDGREGVFAIERGVTSDGHAGRYIMLNGEEADQYKGLGGRRPDIVVSDGRAQPAWFTAGRLKRAD